MVFILFPLLISMLYILFASRIERKFGAGRRKASLIFVCILLFTYSVVIIIPFDVPHWAEMVQAMNLCVLLQVCWPQKSSYR